MTAADQASEKVSGTRPQGVRDEREAAARVQQMFSQIAPRYDFLNHLLSFSLDRLWRRRTAQRFLHILRRPDARVLDVCCGTGDLAQALDAARAKAARNAAANCVPLVGCDFVLPMLERADAKASRNRKRVVFSAADAMKLPFRDEQFDLVTSAFGFRNLANYELGLLEIARVLKRGGEVGILEFSEPGNGPLAGVFRFYFRRILPLVGGVISGSREAYSYLPASVQKFPSAGDLVAMMQRCGFATAQYESWNFGSVVLHSGRREGT